jgi:DNA repair photolyase
VMVAPITPFINDHEIEAIMEQAAQAGARSAHYTVLRLPFELKEVFQDWLQEHRPLAANRVLARLRDLRAQAGVAGSQAGVQSRGGSAGRLNDPRFITRMKGEGHWADLISMRFGLAAKRFALRRDRPTLDCNGFLVPVRSGCSAPRDSAQGVLFD